MAEKVIHEMRIIETDDGFRIEIKGDKDRLRELGKMWGQFGAGRMGHGPWGHRGPGGRRGFGFPFGRHHGYGGPWSWWGEEEEEGKQKPEATTQA